MRLGGGVQIAQRRTGLNADRSGVGIDVDGIFGVLLAYLHY